MTEVLIFHGTGGSPEGNWFPWLKNELEQKGHKVFVPKFPDPREGNNLEDWLKVLEQYQEHINNQTILVGHSLGGLFTLRVLERLEKPVDAAFLVAAPIGVKPILYYDSDAQFSGFEFDWEKIKQGAKHFGVYHSDNDPYVSLGNGEQLAQHLGVDLTFIPQAGHINAESGFTKFEPILKDINKLLE
ncbi:serine hydrolase family protein [Candidatus Daviesbacteria bacterium]|nr:serine hydrolase family protein [Candidatus Daviesbacteria bacterium]